MKHAHPDGGGHRRGDFRAACRPESWSRRPPSQSSKGSQDCLFIIYLQIKITFGICLPQMARRNQGLREEDISQLLEEEDDDGLDVPEISDQEDEEPVEVITEMTFVDNEFVDMFVHQPSPVASPNPR